ncbi:MAG: agmatinase [Acidimicrobiales bacterium]
MAAGIVGPPDGQQSPRYGGPATFARLPRVDQVKRWDVGVLGIPFDSGTSYRPGARFGPSAVRSASRLLRPYNPALDASPFATQQVVDLGDVDCTPYDIIAAIGQIEAAARTAGSTGGSLVAIGGDHTVALPLLRAVSDRVGPVALIHFDAHLDTFDTNMGAAYTHGTPFRRAAEEGCFLGDRSVHVGIRGSVYEQADIVRDAALGFTIITSPDVSRMGPDAVAAMLREEVAGLNVYVSIDVDVADPAFAPGTGTPEAGGLSSRELLMILRGLCGLPIVGADVVEVAPAYDHAETTAGLASNLVFELITMMSINRARATEPVSGATAAAT